MGEAAHPRDARGRPDPLRGCASWYSTGWAGAQPLASAIGSSRRTMTVEPKAARPAADAGCKEPSEFCFRRRASPPLLAKGRLAANLGFYRANDALHCARGLDIQRPRHAQERRWIGPTGRNMRTAQSFDVRGGFGPCLQPLSNGFTDWRMRRPGIALLLFEGASLVARVRLPLRLARLLIHCADLRSALEETRPPVCAHGGGAEPAGDASQRRRIRALCDR